MKKCTFLISAMLICSFLYSQSFPIGKWGFTTDINGNPISSKKTSGQKQVTIFEFQDGKKYFFSFEEFDSVGNRTVYVNEVGKYSFTNSQFTLTPAKSTTIFYSYINHVAKPASSSVSQNPLDPVTYSWEIRPNKSNQMTLLAINALRPGFREGFFTNRFSKKAPTSSEDPKIFDRMAQDF